MKEVNRMEKELLEILKQVYKTEMKNLEEDEVNEEFLQGANFGMQFMIRITSDCLDGASEAVKEIYSD